MSLPELQACLARLYVDDAFRESFLADAGIITRKYHLTLEERGAIEKIDRVMLGLFASSLRRKRREAFERAYPSLFAMDGSLVGFYYDRYYDLFPANPYCSLGDEVRQFGLYMEDSLAYSDETPVWASELARYERLFFTAQFAQAIVPETQCPVWEDMRPTVTKSVTVSHFRYDVPTIDEMLRGGGKPDPAPDPADHLLLFAPGPAMLRLSSASHDLIEMADGHRTVSDIVGAMERKYAASGLRDDVVASFVRFQRLGIVAAS